MNEHLVFTLAAMSLLAVLASRLLLHRGVKPDVVRQKIAAGAVVVDVRTPREFGNGAYPAAINVPLQELGQRIGEFAKDRPLVLYCRSGARSAVATDMLKKAGFVDVINAGGLSDMPR